MNRSVPRRVSPEQPTSWRPRRPIGRLRGSPGARLSDREPLACPNRTSARRGRTGPGQRPEFADPVAFRRVHTVPIPDRYLTHATEIVSGDDQADSRRIAFGNWDGGLSIKYDRS